MSPSELSTLTASVSTIARSDRWLVRQRLQELHIPCHCLADGQLSAEIHSPIDILQLRSVIQQATATRSDLIDWLERCWQTPGTAIPNH
ncbi:MAG: hypothetical protein NW224_04255 [Leptolyngbyaceae cyanobacterium bins.302]|nr:hypothetical protein [Leptolyngbyaceae cyanobacterium bins.302]